MSATPSHQRALAKLLGTFHNVSYYAPEMKAFEDLGLKQYWRSYMAYRSAPMGIVPASVVEATFYNFSRSHVEAAIPSAWQTTTPDAAMALRDASIATTLHRVFTDATSHSAAKQAADLALGPILECELGARPLFGAHRELPVPDDPLMRLWFACTLWREHRGDGHNLALAAASIDGIECHVLLAAKGVGDQFTIEKIRGWTEAQWRSAHERLVARDLIHDDGSFTDLGKQLRADIEAHTDELAAPPRRALGEANTQRLLDLVEPLVGLLVGSGTVPGRWPPPAEKLRP